MFYFARALRSVQKTVGKVKQMKSESDHYIKKLEKNESLKNFNKDIESNPFIWLYKTKISAKDKIDKFKNHNTVKTDKTNNNNSVNINKSTFIEKSSGTITNVNS